jgi:hypothetical protein
VVRLSKLALGVTAIAFALTGASCAPSSASGVRGANAAKSPSSAPEPKATSTATGPTSTSGEGLPPLPENAVAVPAPPRIELPRGGREIFPTHRLVGFCGTPGAPALGQLEGNLVNKTKKMMTYANKYEAGRKVLPVFELIAVIVQGDPGKDGKSRRRVPDSVVDDYLKAARASKGLLLLNVQPGHSDWMTELKHYEKYLKEPDVGVALDPEWAMKAKQKPGAFYGQTTGDAINEVAAYLSEIVKAGDLPEKALVFHQVNGYVVKDEGTLTAHPGVVLVKSVDGLGPRGAKINTYNYLVKSMPSVVHAGFKLFFDEDTTNGGKLMSPEDVLKLTPEPEYVMYE